jgi:hypothetical protein
MGEKSLLTKISGVDLKIRKIHLFLRGGHPLMMNSCAWGS